MLLGQLLRTRNVALLCGFVTPGEQHNDAVASPTKVRPVTRPQMPAQLRDAAAHVFGIAQVARLHLLEPQNNGCSGLQVFGLAVFTLALLVRYLQ